MLTVLGAVMLLSMVSMGVNSMLLDKTTTMLEAEATLNAVSLAQSMIDEVMSKSFDAATVTGRVYRADEFTSYGGLGPSSYESGNVGTMDTYPYKSTKYFNDVDDYNRYHRKAFTPTMGNFFITDSVYYVSETNPDQKSTTPTYYKKVVVTVRHPNMSYPLQISDAAVYRAYF